MGAANRRARAERGLPRLSEKEREAKRRSDRARAERLVAEKREISVGERLRRGCTDCGYRDHVEALDWDHLPEFAKVRDVSLMVVSNRTSVAALRAEIDKCEVVCANCHRVRTARRRSS